MGGTSNLSSGGSTGTSVCGTLPDTAGKSWASHENNSYTKQNVPNINAANLPHISSNAANISNNTGNRRNRGPPPLNFIKFATGDKKAGEHTGDHSRRAGFFFFHVRQDYVLCFAVRGGSWLGLCCGLLQCALLNLAPLGFMLRFATVCY